MLPVGFEATCAPENGFGACETGGFENGFVLPVGCEEMGFGGCIGDCTAGENGVGDEELNGDGLNACPAGRMADAGLAKGFVAVG